MSSSPRVIVVGGGPVGLTVAFLLADAGVPVTLFESEPDVPQQLRASTWHPPTLDMLAPAGLTDELIARGRITPTWQIRHHETGERAEFDLSILAGETGYPHRLQCEQAIYSEAVAARLRGLEAADIRFGTTVAAVGQAADSAWVELEADGGRTRHTADWVVGCDGARSLVREAIGTGFEGTSYPEITILATTTFPFETVLEGLSGVNYIWKAGGTFSLLHLPDVWRCSFYPEPDEPTEDALADDRLQAHVDEISPDIGPIEILEKRAYRSHQRIAGAYRQGRLFLAGDAAHLNSPKGGMGMNGGLHDAFSLAAKIIAVDRGGDPAMLDVYEAERRPVAEQDILAQADTNRARMHETDGDSQLASLRKLQAIAADPARAKAFLLKSSMIEGLRRAEAVAAKAGAPTRP